MNRVGHSGSLTGASTGPLGYAAAVCFAIVLAAVEGDITVIVRHSRRPRRKSLPENRPLGTLTASCSDTGRAPASGHPVPMHATRTGQWRHASCIPLQP